MERTSKIISNPQPSTALKQQGPACLLPWALPLSQQRIPAQEWPRSTPLPSGVHLQCPGVKLQRAIPQERVHCSAGRGAQLHPNIPNSPRALPWKGFSTLDFPGSTRASWQLTTSRKHCRYPYFPSLCSQQHLFFQVPKKLTIHFSSFKKKNEASVLTGTTCKKGMQNTQMENKPLNSHYGN